MTKFVAPSSLMNGYRSGKQEQLELEEGPPIAWRTHEYAVYSSNGRFFCCFRLARPDISFTAPLTDRVTWEKNFRAIILFISGEKAIHKGFRFSEINLEAVEKEALRATTILERISEASERVEYSFLEPFLSCFNHREFSKRYHSLEPEIQKLFVKIIGGNDALKIIEDLAERLNKLSKIVELIKGVENKEIPVDEKSEEIGDKIEKIEKTQIRRSFMYFQAKKMFGKKGYIFFNGISIKLPDQSSIDDDGQFFLSWLRKKIKLKITKKTTVVDFIMGCLSFNAFSIADSTLRAKFFELFKIVGDFPRWKINSKKPTQFFIDKNDVKQTYKITQVKNYVLKVMPSDDTKLDYDIGEMKVFLQIKFDSKRKILSAKICIKDIVFFDNADLQTQIEVLEKMDLSKKK